ncbi:GNAT family N-acetyltransferase [Neobacillus drentensis]|uniref:GNAT family N-acetyltransferase n=1 Tax=Neobacillus drentensis TaxID=220684 RepID=UPI0030025878
MSEIRKLNNEELKEFVDIVTNAYPGMMQPTKEMKEATLKRFIERQDQDDSLDFYGLFRNDRLLGGMRLHYYQMNLFEKFIPVGGVGLVAVDLLHKKEKAAKELISYFLSSFLEKGTNMVLLYPFRPDFYKKMGFGYGPKMHQYRITPESFPLGPSKTRLRFLNFIDKEKVRDCYSRYAIKTHGMFYKTDAELEGMFKNPDIRIIGFEEDNEIKGYMQFSFEKRSPTNFINNDLVIKEMIFETPEALLEICTFLHTQADQVNRIVWNTQEENVHFLIEDPRNGSHNLLPSVYHESSLSGVGLMYRIINVHGIFEDLKNRNFNHVTAKVKLKIKDTLLPQNNVELILHAQNGWVKVASNGDHDVEISLDISDFSSMLMGVITFKELYILGRTEVSNSKYIQTMNRLFFSIEKPRCTSVF